MQAESKFWPVTAAVNIATPAIVLTSAEQARIQRYITASYLAAWLERMQEQDQLEPTR